MKRGQSNQTIVAVTVSGRLFKAQVLARSLSISSKNLSAVAIRIGQQAAGLAVLASFYDELANSTIQLANKIGELTGSIADLAVEEWKLALLHQHLEKVLALEHNENTAYIQEKHEYYEAERNSKLSIFNRLMSQLELMLSDMRRQMQSISVIAVNSKIEATQAADKKELLFNMAEDIEKTTDSIITHIKASQNCLETYYSEARI
ncbi:MAG: hypothetical protein CMF25_01535 [Kangiellaceae bacterium]|nr:hypothetical protein [Kangiellaceae bacterium]|tara:strand:+ start:1128 stop:1742 length:615 start_codon:yes stop_codon:yes gene_type:complete